MRRPAEGVRAVSEGFGGARLRRALAMALPIVVFALCLTHYLGQIRQTPFQPDETRWINRAGYLRELRHPLSAFWTDRYLTRGQPPLGSYVTGLGLLLQGRDLTTNAIWNFDYGFESESWWNVSRGAMASQDDLIAARRTSAVIGALTAVLVYLLASELANPVGGLVGGLGFGFHSLQTEHATRALADPVLLLLVAAAALAAMRLARRPGWGWAALLGLLFGLGGATKLSPLLVACAAGGYGVALIAYGRWRGRPGSGRLGRALLAVPVVCVLIFVLAYPYLWPDPLNRTRALVAFRSAEMTDQAERFTDVRVDGPLDALERSRDAIQLRGETDLIALCSRFPVCPEQAGIITDIDLSMPLAVVGLVLLLATIARTGLSSPAALGLLVVGGQAAITIAGMRADFPRYHLPILLCVAALAGIGAGGIVQGGWLLLRRFALPQETK